jgi:hypothetical protein
VRAAAGIGAAVAALAVLAAPGAAATGGFLTAAGMALALGLGADDGARALVAIVVAVLAAGAWPATARVVVARVAAVGVIVLAVDLIVDGILGV